MPGGFVGVDIFFVISGFVITAMLRRELAATGRIRLGRFYMRRFKRLAPALAATVCITVIGAALLLPPLGGQQTAAQTGIAAMLGVANLVIAFITGDYFAAPATANPLLHTWSLSVEEQFYLVFPGLLALLWLAVPRIRRVLLPLALGVLIIGSFLLAVRGSGGDGSSVFLGFYSPFTRVWEFALGAILALYPHVFSPARRRLAMIVGALGLAAIIASLYLIDDGTPFPGTWTLLPVLGTALVIAAGMGPANRLTGALSGRFLVAVGDRSYSWYLWHWPAITFTVVLWPTVGWAPAVAAAASFLPAQASYRFLEAPIRAWPTRSRVLERRLIVAVLLPPLVLSAAVWVGADRFLKPVYAAESEDVSSGDIGHTAFHEYVESNYFPCADEEIRGQAPRWETIVRCHQSKPGADPTVVIVGDSHAEHLFVGLAESLPTENVAYYILSAVPVREADGFGRIIDTVAASPAAHTVIVTAYWALRGLPQQEVAVTLETFDGAGKRVYVTDDVPTFPSDPFDCKFGGPLGSTKQCTMPAAAFTQGHKGIEEALRQIVLQQPAVELLLTSQYFCDAESCASAEDGDPLFRDRHHLNINGSRFVAHRLLEHCPNLLEQGAAGCRPGQG